MKTLVTVAALAALFHWPLPASALEPAGGAAEPSEVNTEAVVVGPVETDEEPGEPIVPSNEVEADASVVDRSWLRDDTGPVLGPEQASDSSGLVLALLFVFALGGAALFVRLRRTARVQARVPSALRVVSTARLAPKANLVAVDVGGKVLLLGVTETQVSPLGWLDAETEARLAEGQAEAEPADGARRLGRAARQTSRRFRDIFSSALARGEPFDPNPNVASLLTERSDDVVLTGRRAPQQSPKSESAPSSLDGPRVEDQVAGLLRRRS